MIIAFAAAMLSSLIAFFNIYKHFRNYSRPEYQRSLIRILLIVPIYAILSWLSLAIPSKALIFESIRDCWEAVVIWEFLKLILAYCGGESACLLVIMKKPGSINHMWPLHYCLPPLRLDAPFMRICKRLTLQFVLIKPIMAISNIVMLEICMYSNSAYQNSLLVVYNVSYSLALYGLVLFYLATHHHPGLKSRKPLLKFLAIKSIIFATYYQGLLVQLVPGYDIHYLSALNNFIFCLEMIFFSLLHVWAFGWFEFVGGGVGIGDPEFGMDLDNLAVGGTGSLALHPGDYDIPKNTKRDNIQGNMKDALRMDDVLHDTIENFNPKYENHVRVDTSAQTSNQVVHDDEDEDEKDAANPFSGLPATNPDSRVEPEAPPTMMKPTSHSNGSVAPQSNPFANPFQDDLAHI